MGAVRKSGKTYRTYKTSSCVARFISLNHARTHSTADRTHETSSAGMDSSSKAILRPDGASSTNRNGTADGSSPPPSRPLAFCPAPNSVAMCGPASRATAPARCVSGVFNVGARGWG